MCVFTAPYMRRHQMLYKYNSDKIRYPGIIGDGISDDTTAIQRAINSNTTIIFPDGYKFRLTNSINIDIGTLDLFDGGNSKFIVDGSFPAFVITGSLLSSMSANPTSLTDAVKENEASFIFKNCKIIGGNTISGENAGVCLSGCFKTKIENCYFYKLTDGIIIENTNRDIVILNNHIYAMSRYGVHIKPTANVHQANVLGNIISYAKYCIYMENPDQIANWQFTGNDIEISSYPVNNTSDFRCIRIESDNTKSGQLSEIEIVGNTIQGHYLSDSIIDIFGGTNRYIQYISITGNHISNSNNKIITISKGNNISINGNNIANAVSTVFSFDKCKNIVANGNSFENTATLAEIQGSTSGVSLMGNVGECSGTPVSIASAASGIMYKLNIINGTVIE